MKICIFSKPFHPAIGGLEQIAKILAHEFALAGHAVEVVTSQVDNSSEDIQFLFKITRTSQFKEIYNAFRRSDIILFMNFTFFGVPIAMLAKRSIILSHHGIYNSTKNIKIMLLEYLKKQLTRFFLNISVSNFVAKNIPGKSIVIPNAYDNSLFSYTKIQRISDFVFCGRLVSEKGVNIVLNALNIVLNNYPKTILTIVGDGPERNTLQKKINLNKSEKNVNFTGSLRGEALANKLREHSCILIPSLGTEAFGIVALEGIASCDTVISSNNGGLPEAVGDCGILIEPTVNALVTAMISVLQAKESRLPLPGQPSIEQRAVHLQKHAPKQVAQCYLNVFRQAIK
jgi:glycogen(starch) synthase